MKKVLALIVLSFAVVSVSMSQEIDQEVWGKWAIEKTNGREVESNVYFEIISKGGSGPTGKKAIVKNYENETGECTYREAKAIVTSQYVSLDGPNVALLYAVVDDKMVVHQTQNRPKRAKTIANKRISVYERVEKIGICKNKQ